MPAWPPGRWDASPLAAAADPVRNHLRALRDQRGWTQAALADRLDVSRQTVNALETGRYDPSLPLAFRIARIFECAIEDVFEPEDEEVTVAQSTGRRTTGPSAHTVRQPQRSAGGASTTLRMKTPQATR